MTVGLQNQDADENFAPMHVPRSSSRVVLGHCFGPGPAPGGTALFCFRDAALPVTVSTFGGPTVNAELDTWELGPLAWLRPV
jgi:hypothetical protein